MRDIADAAVPAYTGTALAPERTAPLTSRRRGIVATLCPTNVVDRTGFTSERSSIRLQAADQFGKRVGHRVLLHLLAAEIAVFSFDVQRLTSVAGHGNANQSDGIIVLIRIGACDARDGYGHIGGRTVKRAFCHRYGYFPTDRALCLQEPGIDAKSFNLVRLRVGDEASVQVLTGAGGLR
jgi:hypothetical protein